MQQDSIFITIDVDWACDEVLEYTIEFFERNAIKATFFITHDTPLLERLRNSDLFELGIHPNFQYLLNGTSQYRDMSEVLENILSIVPEAKSVRSHLLVQSSPILELFKNKGLQYDVNLFIPWYSSMTLKPIKHWNGVCRVPYFWEDDVQCIAYSNGNSRGWDVDELLNNKGLKIFNFHPIHLYLNTEEMSRYEKTKEYQRNIKILEQHRYCNTEIGAFSVLSKLVNKIRGVHMYLEKYRKLQVNFFENCYFRSYIFAL